MNLEDQYDRIFKYLYFHLHDRHMAEDMTQEAFLRFLGSRTYRDENIFSDPGISVHDGALFDRFVVRGDL